MTEPRTLTGTRVTLEERSDGVPPSGRSDTGGALILFGLAVWSAWRRA